MRSRDECAAIIVDADFTHDLAALGGQMHVWLVDSAANRRRAEVIWAAKAMSLTLFLAQDGPELDRIAAAALDDVLGHHRELAVVRVYGAAQSAELDAAFAAEGFAASSDEGWLVYSRQLRSLA